MVIESIIVIRHRFFVTSKVCLCFPDIIRVWVPKHTIDQVLMCCKMTEEKQVERGRLLICDLNAVLTRRNTALSILGSGLLNSLSFIFGSLC